MIRKNRIGRINEMLTGFGITKLEEEKKKIEEVVKQKEMEIAKIEEPFDEKIKRLEEEIAKIQSQKWKKTEKIKDEVFRLNMNLIDVDDRIREHMNLIYERNYLEGLNTIEEFLEKGYFIENVEIVTSHSVESYTLGEIIGTTSNFNTPSRITDIQLGGGKSFKIKSEIAKSYRAISLYERKYPSHAEVLLVDGIYAKKQEGYRTLGCPECNKNNDNSRLGWGKPQYKCPICEQSFYFICTNCGHEWNKKPSCEHKDMIKLENEPVHRITFIFNGEEWEWGEEE